MLTAIVTLVIVALIFFYQQENRKKMEIQEYNDRLKLQIRGYQLANPGYWVNLSSVEVSTVKTKDPGIVKRVITGLAEKDFGTSDDTKTFLIEWEYCKI